MSCLKCGRDTEEEAVFCESCLLDMRRHPVRPGTPVMLPSRDSVPVKRVPKRRAVPPEEQLKSMKRRVRIYASLWFLTMLAAVTVSLVLIREVASPPLRPGQNYTSVISTTSPTVPVTEAVPSEGA